MFSKKSLFKLTNITDLDKNAVYIFILLAFFRFALRCMQHLPIVGIHIAVDVCTYAHTRLDP